MTAQNPNKSNTALIIILAILGAIAILLIGVMLGNLMRGSQPTPPVVVPPTPAPDAPYAVAKDYVNVRTGPSVQYAIYGIAPPGSSAEVIGKSEDGGWWVVKLPTELVGAGQGWVSAEFTEAYHVDNVPVVEAPPLQEIIIPTPQPGAPSAETLEAVNVRSGPGTDYPAYGVAPKGLTIEVVGQSEDGEWWVVKIPTEYVSEGQGWVSADYVRTKNADDVPVVPAP